jgi:hypothetical protein
MNFTSLMSSRGRNSSNCVADLVEALLAPADEVHLVDGDARGAGCRSSAAMKRVAAASARCTPVARVDEHDGEVGGARRP